MTAQTQPMPRIDDEPVLLRRDEGGVAFLTLNRPRARNALSVALMTQLEDSLAAIATDAAARVVVIAGAGPAFCAGHDLREIRANPGRAQYEALFAQCGRLMLAVAAEDAKFASPGVNIGLFCSTPMVALSRAVGRKPAMEMLLTGDLVGATRARELGLVNRVVPLAELDAEVTQLAREIAGKSAHVLAIGKEAFYRQAELGVAEAYDYASEVMTRNMLARDAEEGIDAFIAKREPVWRDC